MNIIETFIPDWIPNFHPLIIHFPIVLLLLVVFIQLIIVVVPRFQWLTTLSLTFTVTGFLSLVVTYFSGRQASDSVFIPNSAYNTLSKHADLAFWTLIYFGILLAIYLLIRFLNFHKKRTSTLTLFLLSLIGMYFIVKTADLGGRLVYKYGVGVQNNQSHDINTDDTSNTKKSFLNKDGSWSLTPDSDIKHVMGNNITWIEGSQDDISIEKSTFDGDEKVIEIVIENSSVLITGGNKESNVRITAEMNLNNFKGQLSLVHHVTDKVNYEFFRVVDKFFSLGRIENNSKNILAKKFADHDDWVKLSVVANNRHFRGYLNDELLLHSHAKALPAGMNGLRIEGSGVIYLKVLTVNSLQEEDEKDNDH